MTTGRGGRGAAARTAAWTLMLALTLLMVPSPTASPAPMRLTRVESAKFVDFREGVLWILVLGSDARPGEDLRDARTDAIQLVGINWQDNRAVAIGVPRDSYVRLPEGRDRINTALIEGGTDLAATAVRDLVGITPDYVFVARFEGFRDMVETIGGVQVRSPDGFYDEAFDLRIRRGVNRLGGTDALDYTRSRRELAGGDFDRSANQQRVMLAILTRLRAREDEEGFIERGALAALAGLDTDLAPTELYRLAQAVTQVRPDRVTRCVIGGTPGDESGASVVYPDIEQARRLGREARGDARLETGCDG